MDASCMWRVASAGSEFCPGLPTRVLPPLYISLASCRAITPCSASSALRVQLRQHSHHTTHRPRPCARSVHLFARRSATPRVGRCCGTWHGLPGRSSTAPTRRRRSSRRGPGARPSTRCSSTGPEASSRPAGRTKPWCAQGGGGAVHAPEPRVPPVAHVLPGCRCACGARHVACMRAAPTKPKTLISLHAKPSR